MPQETVSAPRPNKTSQKSVKKKKEKKTSLKVTKKEQSSIPNCTKEHGYGMEAVFHTSLSVN